jgi:hypothetical protein
MSVGLGTAAPSIVVMDVATGEGTLIARVAH